jgi:tetratricopeptide (TPR) repeat protein
MVGNLDKPATQSEHGSMPSLEFRLQTCRLLVQLEKYKPAIQVLELLVKEDDELVEAWYLLAFSFFKRSKWENAKECCLSLHNTCTKNKIVPDKELQTATKEIYDSVVAKLA